MKVVTDPIAECQVVGCAVASPYGARLALAAVDVGDFYLPAHRAAMRACAAIDELAATYDCENRIAAVAQRADVSRSYLRRLVWARATMWDRSGQLAARVAEAAMGRRTQQQLLEGAEAIAAGAEPSQVVAMVSGLGA